jgi:group II intron reverse transcriptase/maturase
MAVEAVYEQDFMDCSYGFRRGRSAHKALDALWHGLMETGGGWVLEADIQGFFDNLDRGHLRAILDQRVRDGVLRRTIDKWLKAGVLEDGSLSRPETGTPQGGVISPLLANVYLHEVLDQWFEQEVRTKNGGQSRWFRFADDFVACFEYRHEAEAFERKLKERWAAYGLEVAPDKTKTIRFGRNGGTYNGRFDFLGFEFRWEASRKGLMIVKRRTSRKKLQARVRNFAEGIKTNRSQKLSRLMKRLAAKYQGYWNYYGVIGNTESLGQFWWQSGGLLFKGLNRRSQRQSDTWRAFHRLWQRFQVPPPRIVEKDRKQLALPCCWGWRMGRLLARPLFIPTELTARCASELM